MHTPDGLLTGWVCVAMALASLAPILISLNGLRKNPSKDAAVRLASVAAVIFAAQMLNFPVGGGTSGHLLGAAFAFFALGADGAIVAMAAVLFVQALAFGDGGILALGANVFSMAVVGVYSARFAYARWGHAAASLASVVAASASCAMLLVLSGAPAAAVPAMLAVHSIIGIGEAALGGALLFAHKRAAAPGTRELAGASAAAGIALIALAAPFASADPDGLERVSMDYGFYSGAATVYEAPMQDYLSGLGVFGAVAACALGAAMTYGLALAALCAISRPRVSVL